MVELSFLSLCFFITSLFFFVMVPIIECDNLLVSNITTPVSPSLLSISIILVIISLSISYTFMIPIFVIMFVVGYMMSIRYLPKFVESMPTSIQMGIEESNLFPYYSTIILTIIWPIIYVVPLILSITKMVNLSINTPNKAVKRKLEQIKKNG